MFRKSGDIQIAARIAQVRHHHGFSQGVMAAKLGLSDSAYKNYEKGRRDIPLSVALRLCSMFNLNFMWLFTGIGKQSGCAPEESIYELWAEVLGEGFNLALKIRDGGLTPAGKFDGDLAKQVSERVVEILNEFTPTDETQSEIVKQHIAELREEYPGVTFQLPQLMAWANLADDGR